MSSEATFYHRANERRVQFAELGRPGFNQRAVLYINFACALADALGIKDFPVSKVTIGSGEDTIVDSMFKLEEFMDVVRARNLFILEPGLRELSVQLDPDWRAKATTLVNHIRDVVQKAEMSTALREPILRSLNRLQDEIDRDRTRLDVISEMWLQLTSAMGNGAKNLEPAVRIVERLGKAFGRAKHYEIEAEQKPQLPPPDDLSDEE